MSFAQAWRVSLHGGHSQGFCDHATSPLREMIEAAVARGLHTYGVTEHAPRTEPRFLYPEEIALGWDVARLARNFEAYAHTVRALAEEFADRLEVLCGFEAEVVPPDRYPEVMLGLRERFGFDYLVGSVHWVDGIPFDYSGDEFTKAVAAYGGIEGFACRYYETVAEMVRVLEPEVVGHLDLMRKFAGPHDALDTPAIRRAAEAALEAMLEHNCIVDVNTVALRRGLGAPYPAAWLVQMAREIGLGFCFGDDSHCAADVGAHLAEARQYLLDNGVHAVTVLARQDMDLVRRPVPLE